MGFGPVTIIFWIAAAVALLGGFGVIVSREAIRSVLSLVLVMIALSVLFLVLSAQFLFAVQVIVYAGAVMVLFLFVIALLGPAREDRPAGMRFQWWLSLLVAAVFFFFLWSELKGIRYHAPLSHDVSLLGTVQSIGIGLFTTFLYPFELTSLLLLVAAVGAIYLARGDRPVARRPRRDAGELQAGAPAEELEEALPGA